MLLGGQLIGHVVSQHLLAFDVPMIDTGIGTAPEAAIAVIVVLYVVAALFNLRIPRTEAPLQPIARNIGVLVRDFSNCNARLWNDKLGQISLATTTLFWGVSGNLRVHRPRLGGGGARLHDDAGVGAGRRGRDRHRRRRDRRLAAHAPRPRDRRHPARHRDGRAGGRR